MVDIDYIKRVCFSELVRLDNHIHNTGSEYNQPWSTLELTSDEVSLKTLMKAVKDLPKEYASTDWLTLDSGNDLFRLELWGDDYIGLTFVNKDQPLLIVKVAKMKKWVKL